MLSLYRMSVPQPKEETSLPFAHIFSPPERKEYELHKAVDATTIVFRLAAIAYEPKKDFNLPPGIHSSVWKRLCGHSRFSLLTTIEHVGHIIHYQNIQGSDDYMSEQIKEDAKKGLERIGAHYSDDPIIKGAIQSIIYHFEKDDDLYKQTYKTCSCITQSNKLQWSVANINFIFQRLQAARMVTNPRTVIDEIEDLIRLKEIRFGIEY